MANQSIISYYIPLIPKVDLILKLKWMLIIFYYGVSEGREGGEGEDEGALYLLGCSCHGGRAASAHRTQVGVP